VFYSVGGISVVVAGDGVVLAPIHDCSVLRVCGAMALHMFALDMGYSDWWFIGIFCNSRGDG
jgi:hypothetical protein